MKPLDVIWNAAKFHSVIKNIDKDMKDLPPLRAVAAFEACYRLKSFTRAAASLNVRQPAISHQIRLLERDLGTKLFIKRGATIDATPNADELYLAVSSGLSEIARGSERIRRRGLEDTLSLATYPGIAAFWLLPRIARLSAAEGAPPVRVTTADRDADIPLADVDCAILFGTGDWPGYETKLVAREEVVPVAAPALAAEWLEQPPEALLEHGPLIHLEDPEARWHTWADWKARRAPTALSVNCAFTVTNHGIAIQEALLGAGVALGWSGVIDDLVSREALVPLHERPIVSDRGYYLILSEHLAGSSRRAWLLELLGLPDNDDAESGVSPVT